MILSNRLEAEFSKRDIVMVLYTCAHSTHNRDERQRTTDRRTDDNEEGEVALVEKAYLTVVTIITVINSLGAMANAALRTRTWLDVKRWEGFPTA